MFLFLCSLKKQDDVDYEALEVLVDVPVNSGQLLSVFMLS